MTRVLKVAAIQMRTIPLERDANLELAGGLVAQAAEAGAQLVLLPELFNTGYIYESRMVYMAETLNGHTVGRMKEWAAQYGIHLAGTLLLTRGEDIFNTFVLVAPDGRLWQYDKSYPWFFEGSLFRKGNTGPVVAETDLGRFGMITCWDAAHADLFRAYQGRVDALLVSSSPPRMHEAIVVYPDGYRATFEELFGLFPSLYKRVHGAAERIWADDLRDEAAYIGVPVVAATVAGRFSSPIPRPRLTGLVLSAGRPELWPRIGQFADARLEADFFGNASIIAGDGSVLKRPDGDNSVLVADVELPDSPPSPKGPPPEHGMPEEIFLADRVVNWLMEPLYHRNVRRLFPAHKVPPDPVEVVAWGLVLALLWSALRRRRGD